MIVPSDLTITPVPPETCVSIRTTDWLTRRRMSAPLGGIGVGVGLGVGVAVGGGVDVGVGVGVGVAFGIGVAVGCGVGLGIAAIACCTDASIVAWMFGVGTTGIGGEVDPPQAVRINPEKAIIAMHTLEFMRPL